MNNNVIEPEFRKRKQLKPPEHLDKLVSDMKDGEADIYEDYVTYADLKGQNHRKFIKFETHDGIKKEHGSDTLIEQVYQSNIEKMGKELEKKGQDDESVANTIEDFIMTALYQMGGEEQNDAEEYLLFKDSGEYKEHGARIQALASLARDHLGLEPNEIGLMQQVFSDKNTEVEEKYSILRQVTDKLKKEIGRVHLNKRYEKAVARGDKNRFTAYMIKKIGDDHGAKPDNIAKELIAGARSQTEKYHTIKDQKDAKSYAKLGYKSPEVKYDKAA